MKTRTYECDGGTIMIGTKESRTSLPNGYGDGEFEVSVIEGEDKKEFSKSKGWQWVGAVEGENINVYSYDCLHEDELDDSILYNLSGRFGVYCREGDIVLERWD